MHISRISGEGELRGQPTNPGSPGKMAVKTECVCVCVCVLGLGSAVCTLLSAILVIFTACAQPNAMPVVVVIIIVKFL